MNDPTDANALAETEAALDGPLSALTPTAALSIVDRWQSACRDAGLDAVAGGLGDLRDLLSGDRLDGRAISDTLARLAEATRSADVTDARVRPRLDHIAAALDRAATTLAG